jgi:DNA-binding CsgD family transcriptional regulator
VLIGREAELDRLHRLLADARLHRSGSLVLRGDAGVGKTALLDEMVTAARDFLVLRVTGVAAEADLPFAALDALLRPILDLLDTVPPAQARALRAALGLDETKPIGLAAYAGALSLLSAAASERGPVLVAVDDAHWLDQLSAQALTFAARRIAGEGIALIFATRSEGDAGFIATGLDELTVQTLPTDDAVQLLRDRWGAALGPGVARRLATDTGGNPLALLEVATLLSDGQRTGLDPVGDALPVTESIERSVRLSLSTLPAETREALLLAAASGLPSIRPSPGMEPAEEVGLIRIHDGDARFRHPLVGTAIYALASPAERRQAHRTLATRSTGTDGADRRAWHLAAAAEWPDEAAAEALEAAAARAEGRSGFGAQAQALLRAAELTADDEVRARRLLAAATAGYWAGDSALAVRLAELALSLATETVLHAAVLHRLAVIADFDGRWRDRVISSETLEHEAAVVAPLDTPRAIGLLGVILQRRFQALETREALDLAERRLGMAEPSGTERHLRSLQDLARATGLRGEAARCTALCDEILDREASSGSLGFATNIAEPLMWLERYDVCRSLLTASAGEARAHGNVVRLTFEMTNLALLDSRTGSFVRALAGASEAAELATETGNDYLLACNLAVLTRLTALRGDDPTARKHARRATEIADRLSDALIAAEVRMAQAEAALAIGNAADAVALLEPLRDLAERNEVAEPGVMPFAPDLIEAYVRTGRPSDAELELDRLEGAARAVGRRWALAAAARCRGLLADPTDIDHHFATALTLGGNAGWSPFQMARTQLLYGERLRRSRRRVDARAQLRAAIEMFDRLGAVHWSERARAELEASGETIPGRNPTVPEKLTPQELQIALQVAGGKSNRETAEALFLSPKTVEFHLTRVYRKLDVNSRAELIRLLVHDAASPAALHDQATPEPPPD